jgi:hypothetical protein
VIINEKAAYRRRSGMAISEMKASMKGGVMKMIIGNGEAYASRNVVTENSIISSSASASISGVRNKAYQASRNGANIGMWRWLSAARK